MLRVDRSRVLAFRARASCLDERVADPARAAYGGLQDSAPRAAVISLHARIEGCTPSSWEGPALAQIWFRAADYVVPRDALAAFTIGRMPRDPDAAAGLERMTDQILRVLDGQMRPTREVGEALPELGHAIRLTSITGRVLIRWDASKIWAIPSDRPDGDVEDARVELARRFVRWFGPITRDRFAWWSGIEPDDTATTWGALDLERVEVDGRTRFVLAEEVGALVDAEPVHGVRLLPHSDPVIKFDGDLVVLDPVLRREVFPQPGVKTDFWPVAGAILCDGEVAGSWARQQRRVTLNPWRRFSGAERDAAEAEALSIPVAKGKASVSWT